MRTVTKTVYQFDELSDRAKERARDWLREAQASDSDWYDSVYEDAQTIGALMGIEMDQKPVKLMGGATRYDPAIYFSGFSSQGDGACFEGRYAYAKGGLAKVKAYAPSDAYPTLVAHTLQQVQAKHGYRLTATVKHSGHYYHPGCTDIDVYKGDDYAPEDVAETVRAALRMFMGWIYKQLEAEDEYRNSDEQIDESIRANEYEFEPDGSRTRD
jgi:hypothetical protein